MGDTILVVAAHPDDEVLGCGGVMALLAGRGHAVHVAILGEGATSRGPGGQGDVDALRDQARRAGDILGARQVMTFGLPDNTFDSLPLLDVVKIVEGVVDEIAPTRIYTHFGGDLNVDHQVTHRAVLTATRPMRECGVREILAFEVPSSTEWAFGRVGGAFNPTVFMDVAGTLERKIEAMAVYETESRPFPHPRSPQALRMLAGTRGAAVGLDAAEAFELVRGVYPAGEGGRG